MGTVSFEVPGPGTYQVQCDPSLTPLTNPAAAGDVLAGKRFYNDQSQAVTGTIETKSASDVTAYGPLVAVPPGYYPQAVNKTVSDPDLVPGNIKAGVDIFGVTGSLTSSFSAVLVVTVDSGAEVTATDGTTTLTATSTGTATFHLPNGGTWTVSATLNGSQATPATVEVQENFSVALSAGASQTVNIPAQYEAELSFTPSRLPEGYTEVEYIYRPGYGSYLNGKYPISTNKKYTLKIKYEGHGTTNTTYSFLEGAYRYSNYTRGIRIYGLNTGGIEFDISRDTTGSFKSAVFTADESFGKDVELTFDIKNKTASLNGVEKPVSFTFSSFLRSPIPMIMGTNAAADVMQGRLYFYKEYENDVLVSELVPCVNPSGVVGVYDIVNDEFKSSEGSVQFIAGPAV